jgi:hypothetical protein
MLKEILSQSRKSGSLSRQGEHSATLSRQPSTERKNHSRIELHCNSGKKLDLAKEEKECKGGKGGAVESSNIDQVQFKNLVKNKLVREK